MNQEGTASWFTREESMREPIPRKQNWMESKPEDSMGGHMHGMSGTSNVQFKKNELVIDAVVRNLEIIGEASKSISPSTRLLYQDIPSRTSVSCSTI